MRSSKNMHPACLLFLFLDNQSVQLHTQVIECITMYGKYVQSSKSYSFFRFSMEWWQASAIIFVAKKWENNLKCLEEFTASTAPLVNATTILLNKMCPRKNLILTRKYIYSLPITIFSGKRLSSFTKFKPKQRNIQRHLTATVLRGQRGVAVHWAASIEGEKEQVLSKSGGKKAREVVEN